MMLYITVGTQFLSYSIHQDFPIPSTNNNLNDNLLTTSCQIQLDALNTSFNLHSDSNDYKVAINSSILQMREQHEEVSNLFKFQCRSELRLN